MVRIFSIRRAVLSLILGFLLPLCYAFTLSEAADYTGKTPPDFMVMPFGWPRPLWIFIMGRQPTEADVMGGIIFLAVCNIVFYGVIVYVALLMLSVIRRRRVDYEPPPQPERFRPRSE
ncbi:MAG: hypothetical protein M3348_12085 [Acidobacteriota bacterium]|nr:hypothetical protein [Acidobacteriota bacterium]